MNEENRLFILKLSVSLFGRLVAWGGGLVITDRQTDTHRPGSVTLAANVRRGLQIWLPQVEIDQVF